MGNHCVCFGTRELLAGVKKQYEGDETVQVSESRCVGYCSSAPNALVGQQMIHLATVGAVTAAVDRAEPEELHELSGCGCGQDHAHQDMAPVDAETILKDNDFLGDL